MTWSISPQTGTFATSGNTLDYTAPTPIAASQKITITATSTFDPTVSGTASVQLNVGSISIAPASVTLTNSQRQQFTATVSNLADPTVTWSISPQVGSIDQTGLYSAPALTASQKVTVTATSVADPTRSATATITLNPLVQVGTGAPTDIMTAAFQNAWSRNGFSTLTVSPPLGNVKGFGSTGYVQTFTDAANSALQDALVTSAAVLGGTNYVVQIMAPLYAYYSPQVSTVGYPLGDSQSCSAQGTVCVWDTFDKNAALFSYVAALANGQNFSVLNSTVSGLSAPFYTEWTTLGGMGTFGPPVSALTAITATTVFPPATTATGASVQTYDKGAIYFTTSTGPNRGKIFGVSGPIYTLYTSQGGPGGALGMPTSEAFLLSANVFKQNFEGGVLQYTVGSDPAVLLPVASIALAGAQAGSTITLNLGQSVTVTATPMITSGVAAPDRPVSWSTSNGKVLSIAATGGAAVITAVGGGAASVQAASGGVSSARINFIVISPCCQVGDGAPLAVQQAFRDAVARNRLNVDTPLAAPAARVGSGYVQMATAADSGAVYMLAQSDRLGTAYVVTGALLARYQALGGPAGTLGYPASDVGPGGTQLFANAALAGNPVRLVAPPVLGKWALLGYDSGAAGLPLAEASPFDTPGANSGQQQSFSKGAIVGASIGPRAGEAHFVSGLILARWTALGGASGDFGMPTSDEFTSGALHQQNFEGGNLSYLTGDAAAVEHGAARVPGVIAFPASVAAGATARLAVFGFPNGSTLRVSITGHPDFTVDAAAGAYGWEMAIPLAAKSGPIAIHAVDGKGATADGSLTVRGFADNRVQISKVQGDNQSGLPGSVLPLTVRVKLLDPSNTGVVGAPVTFTGSTGVELSGVSVVTDADGMAEALVRLPATEGIAAINVNAPSIAQAPVTFFARAASSTLTGVPKLLQAGDTPLGRGTATIAQKGALLTAVASILQYHQNRGELKAPNGPADPAALNQFLTQACVVDTKGAQVCDGYLAAGDGAEQVVNLWRAADFTGGVDVTVLPATARAAADALAQGSPVLLSLALARNGVAAGGHFVVATGVAADGSLAIQDPNPFFGRASLTDYLKGFTAGGGAWTGVLRGVVQFALRSPSATRFLVGALSQPAQAAPFDVQSPAGPCGSPAELGDAVDSVGNSPGIQFSYLQACDGAQPVYQVGVSAQTRAFLTDLASAGATFDLSGGAATYQVTRTRLNVVLALQAATFTADGVVNGATFTPGIAPGGIFSIFGSGLAGSGSATIVDFDGAQAAVIPGGTPFQINAIVPESVAPGLHTLRIRSPFGTAQQTVTVSTVAPGIFLIGDPPVAAVENQDFSLNGPSSPLPRGQTLVIYATGLGAYTPAGRLLPTITPVTVVLNGRELPAAFAGRTTGIPGLYQVNVSIPAAIPPDLEAQLVVKQGGQVSNTVVVSIQ